MKRVSFPSPTKYLESNFLANQIFQKLVRITFVVTKTAKITD